MNSSKDSPLKKSKGSLWELLPGAIFVLPYKEHPTPLYLSADFKELFSLESKEEEDRFFQGGYLRKISPEDISLFASHFEAPHLKDNGEITFDCRFLSGEGNYHTLRFQYHAIEEGGGEKSSSWYCQRRFYEPKQRRKIRCRRRRHHQPNRVSVSSSANC